ncbi:MAG: YhcH/YjgK/YiaL family protein [Pirellulaceae bacterium]|nr:YhcH/YjgK/YiaL family protein [Pirellulaceae bacterium]
MIIATFDKSIQYAACHPGIKRGFDFLESVNLEALADGKHEIDGQRLIAICAREQGRGRESSFLEFHRKYIDIQYVVSGNEVMGWRPLSDCRDIRLPYDIENDIGFFNDRPLNWFEVPAKSFTIFFPEDAHSPLAATGPIHKIVIKVAVV